MQIKGNMHGAFKCQQAEGVQIIIIILATEIIKCFMVVMQYNDNRCSIPMRGRFKGKLWL